VLRSASSITVPSLGGQAPGLVAAPEVPITSRDRLSVSADGSGSLQALAAFTTDPSGAAIVNAVGPIRQTVAYDAVSPRRYLVIARGTVNHIGEVTQVQMPDGSSGDGETVGRKEEALGPLLPQTCAGPSRLERGKPLNGSKDWSVRRECTLHRRKFLRTAAEHCCCGIHIDKLGRRERRAGLVSVNRYLIQDISKSSSPLPAKVGWRLWYRYYFRTERGRFGLTANRRDSARLASGCPSLSGSREKVSRRNRLPQFRQLHWMATQTVLCPQNRWKGFSCKVHRWPRASHHSESRAQPAPGSSGGFRGGSTGTRVQRTSADFIPVTILNQLDSRE
jgi:hypothetical protein